jgi:FkbM family methyltransferase
MSLSEPDLIVAVDANPDAHDRLVANLSRNSQVPFITVNAAVTGRIGAVEGGFTQDNNNGSFSIDLSSGTTPLTPVTVRSLKSLREEFGDYDLLKLDIEGTEAEAILSDYDWIAERQPVLWVECNENRASLNLLSLLLSLGYAVYYYRYPAFNPRNCKGRSDKIFAAAFEAGMLAVKEHITPICPDEALEAGASLFRISSTEALRKALWLTPRWGKSEWELCSATEMLALLSRQAQGSTFDKFLNGPAPTIVNLPTGAATEMPVSATGSFEPMLQATCGFDSGLK